MFSFPLSKKNISDANNALLQMIHELQHFGVPDFAEEANLVENIDKITQLIAQGNNEINLEITDSKDPEGTPLLMSFLRNFNFRTDPEIKMMLECMQKFIDAGASLETKNKENQNILDYTIVKYKKRLLCSNVPFVAATDEQYRHSIKILKNRMQNSEKYPKQFSDKKLFSVIVLLLNAGATFNIDNPWFLYDSERSSLDLFKRSEISQFNCLFLFLKGISQQLIDEQMTSCLAYDIIYKRINQLIERLSTKPEQKTDGTAMPLNVLHQEAQKLYQKLPKPMPNSILSTEVQGVFPVDLQNMVLAYYPYPDIVQKQPTVVAAENQSSQCLNRFWSRGRKIVDGVVDKVDEVIETFVRSHNY